MGWGRRFLLIEMAYLVFWLAYSLDWDGVLGVLVGIFFWLIWRLGVLVGVLFLLRWHICCFDWCTCCFCLAYLFIEMAWHVMYGVIPFAFSILKKYASWKKVHSSAGGAGDKSQLIFSCFGMVTHPLAFLWLDGKQTCKVR